MNTRMLIKIGGRAFEEENGFHELAKAIKAHRHTDVMIVHGGGSEISAALKNAGRKTEFIDGIRVTQAADIKIVEAVLSETVNHRIAAQLESSGLHCRRMSGRTDGLFIVRPLKRNGRDYGYVGQIHYVNAAVVVDALEKQQVPVISPISADEDGHSYNVNADSAASALAVATQCTDLVYLTDVPGVCVGKETRKRLSVREAGRLIADGTIKGGMVAKMESAFEAIAGGVSRVHVTCWEGPETFSRLLNQSSDTATIIEN
ncbi:MAG: acetylglutamate kinase [Deltaproteobacteria bacterium]|nr:MAG: acetylglutamate kinase [Deltaproteobacteria bacterium]